MFVCVSLHMHIYMYAFFNEETTAIGPTYSYYSDSFYFCYKDLILEVGVYIHDKMYLNFNSFT